jgi:catechol 2,3-dioxygenase-like lactoylglutathione lyase family enzyme
VIDHVSVAVSDIAAATRFYDALLATIGVIRLETRPGTVGFGKKYPEFWINLRGDKITVSSGSHICFRART